MVSAWSFPGFRHHAASACGVAWSWRGAAIAAMLVGCGAPGTDVDDASAVDACCDVASDLPAPQDALRDSGTDAADLAADRAPEAAMPEVDPAGPVLYADDRLHSPRG
jgi:hypothetical protein